MTSYIENKDNIFMYAQNTRDFKSNYKNLMNLQWFSIFSSMGQHIITCGPNSICSTHIIIACKPEFLKKKTFWMDTNNQKNSEF